MDVFYSLNPIQGFFDRVGSTHAADTVHVYYSFQVGDQLFDDSIWTQLKVFSQRLSGSNAPIRFTRVTFRGPLPDQPTDYERGILDWLGQTAPSER